MKYVYPAIFTPTANGVYSVLIPDLPGCRTFGNSLAEAIEMAEDAAAMWLADAESNREEIPTPSENLDIKVPEFMNLIKADTDKWRKANDSRAVKKTLTIPSWLNTAAEKSGVNFSQVLQDGLKRHLGIE